MQFRRNLMSPVFTLLLAGVVASLVGTARAEVVHENPAANAEMLKARAKRSMLECATCPTDTVWVGHTLGNLGADRGGNNPFHIGTGGARVLSGGHQTSGSVSNNAFWNFDDWNTGTYGDGAWSDVDTLQGWWPLVTPFQSVGGSNKSDMNRPFFGFDYGNEGNYRGNDTKKTTFGVIGYWHIDNGAAPTGGNIQPGTNPNAAYPAAAWTPLDGTGSAWCGLRAHGDLTYIDNVTGQPINAAVISREGDNHFQQIASVNVNGTDANFPGYGDQWNQMMYKDFTHTAGQPMTVSFKYTTHMSNGVQTASNIRIGWFDTDPLDAVANASGNFVSSTLAGVNAPIDSFMVYIGVPVNDAACAYSNTLVPTVTFKPVWDPLRRWFSEVLRIDPQGTSPKPYYELLSTWGVTGGVQSPSWVIPAATLDAFGSSTIRLVFRVHTNRGWSDEDESNSGFSSGGQGAAIVDDVSVQDGGNAAQVTTFEDGSGDIDNTAAPTAKWRTTGKPPGVYFHWHNLQAGNPGGYGSGLPYADPCGPIGGLGRLCNMYGNIVTPGNHDVAGEKPAGAFGANDQDRQDWFMSPTINLKTSGVANDANGWGLDVDDANATSDVFLTMDGYVNLLQFAAGGTGNGMRIGFQTYPGIQDNTVRSWATPTKTISFSSYDGFLGCANGQNGILPAGSFGITDGTYASYNGTSVPDSMRAFVEHLSICYRRPVTGATCSPSSGPYVGLYLDNLSICFADGASPPGIAGQIWDLWQDAFPTNSDNSLVLAGGVAFDTTAAQVRTGFNSGPQTGNLNRPSVPGDTMYVKAPDNGSPRRVDLIFRILPGPGNFMAASRTTSGGQHVGFVKQRPDLEPGTAATPGDGSFWGSYLQDIGPFGTGTPVGAAQPMSAVSGAGNKWDGSIWLSAKCDTLENNLFPCDAVNPNASAIQPGQYQSTYHESELLANWAPANRSSSDPTANRGAFITSHYRCIVMNTTAGQPLDNTNINCRRADIGDNTANYDAKWTPAGVYTPGGNVTYLSNLTGNLYVDPTTFPAGTAVAGQCGQTKEFSKIIPDGQLTAGSEVEYFFRKTLFNNTGPSAELYPDTTVVGAVGGNLDGSFDGHRWASMSVLPDRWKDSNYGGPGVACMLVVNAGARRGEMPIWDNVANTIGLMSNNKRGAGTGYWIGSTQALPQLVTDLSPNGSAVGTEQISLNLGQKGTLYDVYNVIDGESNVPSGRLGSRYAFQPSGTQGLKTSTAGPSKQMLKSFYRHLMLLCTDLGQQAWGPITDQTDDDIGVLSDFMNDNAGGTRTATLIGRDMVKGLNTDHPGFVATYFGATFRNDDYRGLAASTNDVPDLIAVSPITPLTGSPTFYGVFAPCTFANDVLNLNGAVTSSTAATYENVGAGGPYIAAVYAPATVTHVSNTLVCGWTFGTFGGQGSRYTLGRMGEHVFWVNAFVGVIGSVCGQNLSAPTGVGDGFGSGSKFVNFMNLRSENPMRSGEARIAFGITKTEKVEVKVYDVTGRLVKTVANQVFAGGQEHVVRWDGTDNQGQLVARGVYFYQLRSPSFVSERKLTVLKD